MEAQFGDLLTADLKEDTLTFEMETLMSFGVVSKIATNVKASISVAFKKSQSKN